MQLNRFGEDNSDIFKYSLLGIAVKVNDTYINYNPTSGASDVTEFIFDGCSIYKIPTIEVQSGDIILTTNNKPAYVLNVEKTDQTSVIKIYNYLENTINDYIPTKTLLGIPIMYKIVSMFDLTNNQNNQQINQLLPLMLLKNNKESNIHDLLIYNMMMGNMQNGTSCINPLMLLMSNDDNKSKNIFPLTFLNQNNKMEENNEM